jgi:transposase InsO family protein
MNQIPHSYSTGLIRWRFVIHAFVDGFSRLVTGIQISGNNRAVTVLDLFLGAVAEHGIPSRVCGDHGMENLQVAGWMENNRGLDRGSYIWGR